MLRKSLSTWRVAEKPVPIEAAEVHLLVENLLKTAKEKQKVYEKKEDAKKSFEALIEVLSSIEETIKSEILVRDLEEWNYDIRGTWGVVFWMIRQIVESVQKNFEESFPSKPKTEGFSLWGWWKSATPGIEEINDDILDLQTLDQIFPLLVLVSHGENYTGEAFLDEILKTEIYIRPFWYSWEPGLAKFKDIFNYMKTTAVQATKRKGFFGAIMRVPDNVAALVRTNTVRTHALCESEASAELLRSLWHMPEDGIAGRLLNLTLTSIKVSEKIIIHREEGPIPCRIIYAKELPFAIPEELRTAAKKVVQSSTGTSVTRVISIDDDKPMISDAPLPAPKTPEKMISSQLETLNDNQVIRRRSSRNLLRGRVINTNKASLRNSGLNSSKETLGSSAATIKSNESPATTSQVSFSETSVSETEDRSSQQNTEIDASEGPSSINSLPQRASTTLTGSGLSTTSQDTVEVSNNINTNNSSDSIQAPMTSSPQLGIDLRRSYTNVNRAMIKKLQSTPSRANLFTPVIRKGPSLQVIANANKLSRSTTSIQIPSPQRRDASPVLESSEKKSPRKEKDDDAVSSKVKTKSTSKEKLKKLNEEGSPRGESPASGRRIMFQDEVLPIVTDPSSARKTTSAEKLDLSKARRTSSNDEKLKKMIEDQREPQDKKDKKDKKEKEKKNKERLDASDDIKSSRKKISTDHLVMSVDDAKINKRSKKDKSKSSKSRDLDSSLEDSSSSKVKRKSSNDDRVLSIRPDSGSRSPSPKRSRNESDLEKSSEVSSPKTPKKDSARSGSGSTSGSRTTSPLRGTSTSTSIDLEGTPVNSLLSSVRSRSPTVDYSGPGSLTTSLETSESKSKREKKEKEKKEKKEKEKKEKKDKKNLGRGRATTLKVSKSGVDMRDPKGIRSISFEASDAKKHSLNSKFKLSRKQTKSPKHELPVILHFHGGGFLSGNAKSHETYLREWAKSSGALIISVDYTLAPDAKYPYALDECFYVYEWLVSGKNQLGILPSKIILAGDSAGGNFVLGVTFKAIAAGIRVPDALLCSYPALDLRRMPTPSRLMFMEDILVPHYFLEICLKAYCEGSGDPFSDPLLSPVLADDELLSKLPDQMYFFCGGYDPLLDDTALFTKRLDQVGKNYEFFLHPGLPHGFLNFGSFLVDAHTAMVQECDVLTKIVKGEAVTRTPKFPASPQQQKRGKRSMSAMGNSPK
jgi:acetyl esterase/lipase